MVKLHKGTYEHDHVIGDFIGMTLLSCCLNECKKIPCVAKEFQTPRCVPFTTQFSSRCMLFKNNCMPAWERWVMFLSCSILTFRHFHWSSCGFSLSSTIPVILSLMRLTCSIHRIRMVLDGRGWPSRSSRSNTLPWSGTPSTKLDSSGPHPSWSWAPSRMGHLQLPWACSSVSPFSLSAFWCNTLKVKSLQCCNLAEFC